MANKEFSDSTNALDTRDQSGLDKTSATQLLPSSGDMALYNEIVKTQTAGSPMLPEFHIDTTNILAPPTITMPEQVDCSRYDTIATNPMEDQLIIDLTQANKDASLAKVQVGFQNDYNQGAFESFKKDAPLSSNEESYLDLHTIVDKFENEDALTNDEFFGGQFIYNNFDNLKSPDGLVHKEGLDNWYNQTIYNIDTATSRYSREVLECVNNNY